MKYALDLMAIVGAAACGILFSEHGASVALGYFRHAPGVFGSPDSIDALLFGAGLLAFAAWYRSLAKVPCEPTQEDSLR